VEKKRKSHEPRRATLDQVQRLGSTFERESGERSASKLDGSGLGAFPPSEPQFREYVAHLGVGDSGDEASHIAG